MGPRLRTKFLGIWKHPLFWLALMVTAFFVISLYSGVVAYDNFRTSNSTDAGVVAQAVASTTFHQSAPFYESYDCLTKDRCSFLLVHSSFVLYAAVPFYAVAPSMLTLFALRSLMVGAAAIPLYWLTRQVTRSPAKGLLASGMYLVWAPTLAGDVFSLHLESLLPFDLLLLAALWQAGRYRWGLLAMLLTFLTIEIGPVFCFLVGLFFLIPYGVTAVRRHWPGPPSSEGSSSVSSSPRPTIRSTLRAGLASSGVRYTLFLCAASIVAFVLLNSFRNVWGWSVLGVGQAPYQGLYYNGGATPSSGLSWILTPSATQVTLEYWLILYALVAFLPLLSPRALVISVPWIAYTFLLNTDRFSMIGTQYTMVAAGPIFIGLAYGLRRLPIWSPQPSVAPEDRAGDAVRSSGTSSPHPRRWRSRVRAPVILGVLVVVVVVNILFLPIDPVLPGAGYNPGGPFTADYFDKSLTITPGLTWANQLLSNVPHDASVAASSQVFPLLVNYPYAIVLSPNVQPYQNPKQITHLPFNLGSGPEFAIFQSGDLSYSGSAAIRPDFAANLTNPTVYGLRGYTGSSAIGPLLLFEQNYSSQVAAYGPFLAFTTRSATYWPGNGLLAGPIGENVTNSSALKHMAIRSPPGNTLTGVVWGASSLFFAAGNYTLRVEASATGSSLRTDPTASVLTLLIRGDGTTLLQKSFPASTFVSGKWTNLTVTFQAADPVPELAVEGTLADPAVSIAAAYVTIHSTGS